MTYFILGVLAALCVIAATGSSLILPHLRNGILYLGFVGRVIIGVSAAVVIDHHPVVAFLGAVAVLAAVDVREWANSPGNSWGRWQEARRQQQRLEMLRRKLRIAEDNLALFGPGEAPVHLQLVVEELKREITELEDDIARRVAGR